MYLLNVIILLLVFQTVNINFYVKAQAGAAESLSNIFEEYGYSPTCVAGSLASCEHTIPSSFEKSVTETLAKITATLNEMKPEPKWPRNCAELRAMGDCISGNRTIYPYGCSTKPVQVYCDQDTDGGGWTVFQNRNNLTVREDFYRTWNDYVTGFGNMTGEFWLGLDNLNALVNWNKMEMRIDLEDYDGAKRWAKYGKFNVEDNSTKYTLNIGEYSGNAGDGLSIHNGFKFSTKDQDNDASLTSNCATLYKGAWWYYQCHLSNLNGFQYVGQHASFADGINWQPWRQYNYSLRKTSMKVRPILKP